MELFKVDRVVLSMMSLSFTAFCDFLDDLDRFEVASMLSSPLPLLDWSSFKSTELVPRIELLGTEPVDARVPHQAMS